MIEGRDYILIENDLHPDQFSIQLAMEQYAGVVYTYGSVRIIEEGDRARLSFAYKIESVPDCLSDKNLKEDAAFNNMLGDVLVDILENNDAQIGHGHKS